MMCRISCRMAVSFRTHSFDVISISSGYNFGRPPVVSSYGLTRESKLCGFVADGPSRCIVVVVSSMQCPSSCVAAGSTHFQGLAAYRLPLPCGVVLLLSQFQRLCNDCDGLLMRRVYPALPSLKSHSCCLDTPPTFDNCRLSLASFSSKCF